MMMDSTRRGPNEDLGAAKRQRAVAMTPNVLFQEPNTVDPAVAEVILRP
jgi:hypothetical protein